MKTMKKTHTVSKIPQLRVCKVKHEEVGEQKEVLRTCTRQAPASSLIPNPHKEMNLHVQERLTAAITQAEHRLL
ncbi:hypothetical protein ABVT39_012979 [Epinephelus coioides]